MRTLKINCTYRHFKNKNYQVLGIAEHTETGENLVIYRALYGEKRVFARPYDMFMEEVPEGKVNPTGQKYRFMNYKELEVAEIKDKKTNG